MVVQRILVLQVLCAGLVLLSLAGTGIAQPIPVPANATCGQYGSFAFPCKAKTIFKLSSENRTDPTQAKCCERRLTVNLRPVESPVVLGETATFKATIRSLESTGVNITRIIVNTPFFIPSRSAIADPIPEGCFRSTYNQLQYSFPNVECSSFILRPGRPKKLTFKLLPFIPLGTAGVSTLAIYVTTDPEPSIFNSYKEVAAVNVTTTCKGVNTTNNGTVLTPFQCPDGLFYNPAQADNPKPSNTTCCTTKPSQNCTDSWLPCMPCSGPSCTDSCCPGSRCSIAATFGAKTYYTCVPEEPTCKPEGGRCGYCYGGGVCCDGLLCKWKFGSGTCTAPYTCSSVDGNCSTDSDCCPGTVCSSAGTCQIAQCDVGCVKGSRFGKGCRKTDCQALASAAASKATKN